ncbi:hypothetical protein DCCM_2702 [Desulfocucumis palustris]|uniref:Uncharacterized protein n=1 Tax=Desulfocucumis palustris TaxID=1898651 RepID=A0A2L2XH95_9FIRM|nr:hypothetical protein DCCM_2702 [Desulfocucumis palustris]
MPGKILRLQSLKVIYLTFTVFPKASIWYNKKSEMVIFNKEGDRYEQSS